MATKDLGWLIRMIAYRVVSCCPHLRKLPHGKLRVSTDHLSRVERYGPSRSKQDGVKLDKLHWKVAGYSLNSLMRAVSL